MSKLTIKCTGFRPFRRNTLQGFCEVLIEELGLRLKDIAIHEKGNSRWAQLPTKPQMKDGALVKNADGKLEYFSIAEFTSREIRDAFSAAVIRALLEHTPTAFDDEEPKQSTNQGSAVDQEVPF
jgi:hypothetical protein